MVFDDLQELWVVVGHKDRKAGRRGHRRVRPTTGVLAGPHEGWGVREGTGPWIPTARPASVHAPSDRVNDGGVRPVGVLF